MSRSSPSVLFTQYTDLFCDQTWGDMLAEFFGGICKKKKHLNVFLFLLNSSDLLAWSVDFSHLSFSSSVSDHQTGPRLISRDWRGFRPPVDAALVGRVSISSSPTPTSPPIPKKRSGWRNKKVNKRRGGRRRQSRHVLFDDFWGLYDDWMDYDYGDIFAESAPQEEQKGTPVQNIYFFKGGACELFIKKISVKVNLKPRVTLTSGLLVSSFCDNRQILQNESTDKTRGLCQPSLPTFHCKILARLHG